MDPLLQITLQGGTVHILAPEWTLNALWEAFDEARSSIRGRAVCGNIVVVRASSWQSSIRPPRIKPAGVKQGTIKRRSKILQ
jgi:hypothetical protein